MRLVWFFPLTYVAGIDGFGWFVPYLLVVGAAAAVLARKDGFRRARRLLQIPVPPALSEFEAATA